jgi:phage tail protein X
MTVSSYDVVTVSSDYITADSILWKRYRNRAPKMIEQMMDDNPHLAKCHRYSPFLPVGTVVRIPIDFGVLSGAPQRKNTVVLWGTTGESDPEQQMYQGTRKPGEVV